jgi:hypothetical protein
MAPDPTPNEDQVDLDMRLNDDGRPFVDPQPTQADDVPADRVRQVLG